MQKAHSLFSMRLNSNSLLSCSRISSFATSRSERIANSSPSKFNCSSALNTCPICKATLVCVSSSMHLFNLFKYLLNLFIMHPLLQKECSPFGIVPRNLLEEIVSGKVIRHNVWCIFLQKSPHYRGSAIIEFESMTHSCLSLSGQPLLFLQLFLMPLELLLSAVKILLFFSKSSFSGSQGCRALADILHIDERSKTKKSTIASLLLMEQKPLVRTLKLFFAILLSWAMAVWGDEIKSSSLCFPIIIIIRAEP